MQKGPEYFIEAANMVLHRTRNVRFCMAGSGDMMNQMIYLAAERGIADRFHSLVLCEAKKSMNV